MKIAADIIMEPLTYTFNFTAGLNSVPKGRKSAFIIPPPIVVLSPKGFYTPANGGLNKKY